MGGLARKSPWIEGSLLVLIGLLAFGSRLFSVIRFESIIHEFDPWFNYRATQYLVDHGWDAFINWFDDKSWYPLGRVVGGTVYPGIMVTSAAVYKFLNDIVHMPVSIRDICVLMGPFFSGFTALATYALTKELQDAPSGLFAAAFMAIVPGYISRSVAGSYDNEAIAIFLMMATFYLWIKAVKKGSVSYALLTALAYYYMVASWGGYVFVINLIPLHAFALLAMGRFSAGLYSAYCTFYVLGTLASMTVKWVSYQPTWTSEHMAALGVFGLMQVVALVECIRPLTDARGFRLYSRLVVAAVFAVALAGLVGLTFAGRVAPWAGRFYSLWDTSYAQTHMPIIASVSEHQPTTWGSMFMDLHALIFLFPAGLYLCFQGARDEHVFAILYAVTASYFAGVMVRLILTLAPIMCVCGGMAVGRLATGFMPAAGPSAPGEGPGCVAGKEGHARASHVSWDMRLVVLLPLVVLLANWVRHCTHVTSTQYSSPSVILATTLPNGQKRVIDDFREVYQWLRKNTPGDAKVLAWWDYGYQMAGMADRTTIVDNNTWNTEHIALVGRIFASSETEAYALLRQLDVDYVLVLCGAVSGFAGDDMNKFLWMIRIAEGVFPGQVREMDFYNANGEFRVDRHGSQRLQESLLYKMSYHGMQGLMGPRAVDRVRQQSLADVDPKLGILAEAYSSDNFIVRLFRVREPDSLGRPLVS